MFGLSPRVLHLKLPPPIRPCLSYDIKLVVESQRPLLFPTTLHNTPAPFQTHISTVKHSDTADMPSADFDAAVKASRQLKAKPSNDELLEVRLSVQRSDCPTVAQLRPL